jgi:predicted adenylyl cyclase CyaB
VVKVRLGSDVRIRRDTFGGICYVAHRDDFFAATEPVFDAIEKLNTDWISASSTWRPAYQALAKLGICQTKDPSTREEAYSGPAFLGQFLEIPTVSEPLVLNCFSTAYCPLRCIYCHADDLMQDYRATETSDQLDNVISTARMINSMVAVITGGDPLTRPERAIRLIEGLAGSRALVLDTSGVGALDSLLPTLKKHNVHVRVSLDALSPANSKLRPVNLAYVEKGAQSGQFAQETIRRCLTEGLAVTVQTVISSVNENMDELRDLRDWLVANQVRNWVLHMTVKGGSARRIQTQAEKQKRVKGIVPSGKAYDMLQTLIRDTRNRNLPLDIRCTDTDTTPNSVLLVGSNGSLFTEGYAHHGKVRLYDSSEGRPDTLRKLWHYLDRFGHARRYLNWNPHFDGNVSLDQACYNVPIPAVPIVSGEGLVELEAKYRVPDPASLDQKLKLLGFRSTAPVTQRDEYYDTRDKTLEALDYVVRLRRIGTEAICAIKGPRNWTPRQEYSRIELEFEAKNLQSVLQELDQRGLSRTWYFEKRRTSYRKEQSAVRIELDEIPEVGFFIEMEGPFDEARHVAGKLSSMLVGPERKNYAEIFRDFKRNQGVDDSVLQGASFSSPDPAS